MGHEKSAPHIKTILIVAGISVVTLGLLEQGFRSYYNMMFEDEESRKVLTVPTTELNKLREGEQQHLTSGKMPIDRAMRELAMRGRDNASLHDLGTDITPVQSTDPVPVWGLNVKDAGTPAPATDGGAAMMSGDGGAAMMATDGGPAGDATTTMMTAGDASAPHALPAPSAPHANDASAPHAATDAGTH